MTTDNFRNLENIVGSADPVPLTTFFADSDQDGFGDPDNSSDFSLVEPPSGFTADNTDCDDNNNTVFPGAEELADGLDNNCNGEIDEGLLDPGPSPDVFAIAYTNVNGIPGFNEAAGDVMIAQWVDGSVAGGPDGEVGEGDFIEFGRYPTSFAGTGFAGSGLAGFEGEDFVSFGLLEILVESNVLFLDSDSSLVSIAENVEILALQFSGGFIIFESSEAQERLFVTGELDVADVIDSTLFQDETIIVDGSFSSQSLNLGRDAIGGDQPYIDVDFFLPSL